VTMALRRLVLTVHVIVSVTHQAAANGGDGTTGVSLIVAPSAAEIGINPHDPTWRDILAHILGYW
jgi:hypothetical protein